MASDGPALSLSPSRTFPNTFMESYCCYLFLDHCGSKEGHDSTTTVMRQGGLNGTEMVNVPVTVGKFHTRTPGEWKGRDLGQVGYICELLVISLCMICCVRKH